MSTKAARAIIAAILSFGVAAFHVSAEASVVEFEVGDTIPLVAFVGQQDDPETADPDYNVVVEWEWPEDVLGLIDSGDSWAEFEALAPTPEPVQITVSEYTVTKDGHPVSIIDIDNPDSAQIGHVPRTLRIRISGELEVEILD